MTARKIQTGMLLLLGVLACTPAQPELISLDDFQLVSASNDSLGFVVSVTIESTDSRSAMLLAADYEVLVDGQKRGVGYWEGSEVFNPGRPVSLSLPLKVEAEHVAFWVDALLNRDTLVIDIPLRFRARTDQYEWSFRMDMRPRVALEGVLQRWVVGSTIQLRPVLENISTPSIGLNVSSLPVEVSLFNPYPFDMEISGLDLLLMVSGTPVGNLTVSEPCAMISNQRTALDMVLQVQNLGPLAASIITVLRRELSYTLTGTADLVLGDVEVSTPISTSGELTLPGFR